MRAISYRPTAEGEGHYRHLSDWHRFASSTGEFLLEKIEPLEVELEVKSEGYAQTASERFRVEEGEMVEGIEIRVERGAALTIKVVDAATGEPLSGVRHFHNS